MATGQQELEKIRENESYFNVIYDKHRSYTLNFLRNIYKDEEVLKDLYQNAIIVFLEKSRNSDFSLSCNVQTYINSICRNQLLNRFKDDAKFISNSDDFDPSIQDWYEEEYNDVSEERIDLIEKALNKLKEAKGNCYEILMRFFYKKQSMKQIAEEMEYTNAANAKNQKSRCQQKLKKLI